MILCIDDKESKIPDVNATTLEGLKESIATLVREIQALASWLPASDDPPISCDDQVQHMSKCNCCYPRTTKATGD